MRGSELHYDKHTQLRRVPYVGIRHYICHNTSYVFELILTDGFITKLRHVGGYRRFGGTYIFTQEPISWFWKMKYSPNDAIHLVE